MTRNVDAYDAETRVQVQLSYAHKLASSEDFRWYIGMMEDMRAHNVKRCIGENPPGNRDWIAGRIQGNLDAIDLLGKEVERLQREAAKYGN